MFKPDWKPIESEAQLAALPDGSYLLWMVVGEETVAEKNAQGWFIPCTEGSQDGDGAMPMLYTHYALIAESGKVERP